MQTALLLLRTVRPEHAGPVFTLDSDPQVMRCRTGGRPGSRSA
ncbi:MAG TPA: hypothetical protein VI011_06310 [Asanoa sp.]